MKPIVERHTPLPLPASYAYCERVARREAGNFYHAFRVLPKPQRRAMCVLYAFLRISDDLSDGPGSADEKRALLTDWRRQLDRALAGDFQHELSPALHDVVKTFAVPRRYLDEAIYGVMMDLDCARYATFAELYRYCYHVASVVGLACIHIWGFSDEAAKLHAEKAGIAFQLTNILRDLREDAERGRIYLPREDLERFGYSEAELQRGECNDRFRALMRFQVARARAHYDSSEALSAYLPPAGRAVFSIMSRTYRGLLDAIERRNYDVFSSRVRVSTWRKLAFAARALPMRWGLL
jgi:phytoene synthase